MSERIAAAAKVMMKEYLEAEDNPNIATLNEAFEQVARSMDDEGLLAPEMRPEWGVEVEGVIPDTWYQLNLHGLVPHHYADATWLETREEAESLMADVMVGERYPNARFVRRYISEAIIDE